MTAQLALDVGDRPTAAAIEAVLLAELDHHHREVPDPADRPNREARVQLIAGIELQLDWLARTDPLPADPDAWPCSACFARPGQPCDIPGNRTKWTPPGPRHHLCRGLTGRWASITTQTTPQES